MTRVVVRKNRFQMGFTLEDSSSHKLKSQKLSFTLQQIFRGFLAPCLNLTLSQVESICDSQESRIRGRWRV